MKVTHEFECLADPHWMAGVLCFTEDLMQVVATHADRQTTLEWVVQRVKELLECDEVCVRECELAKSCCQTRACRRSGAAFSWPPAIAQSVLRHVVGGGQVLITPDLHKDTRFPELRRVASKVRAAMIVPLEFEDRITGVLAATESRPGRNWSTCEQWALATIARQVGNAIDKSVLREKQNVIDRLQQEASEWQREHDFAAQLQRSVLPSRPVGLNGWNVFGRVWPASSVGGDAFDARTVGGRRICLAASDVAGKGIPAAIVMVTLQTLLREVCTGERCILEAMKHIDRDLRQVQNGTLVTLFYGELDTESGRLVYHRAGHPYALLRRGRVSKAMPSVGGPPVGLGIRCTRELETVHLVPGDELLLYSDGITDTRNHDDEMYGEERLRAAWLRCPVGSPEQALDRILRNVRAFRQGLPQQDDMTLVVLTSPVPARIQRSRSIEDSLGRLVASG